MLNEHLHIWRIIFHFLHKHKELALQGVGTFTAVETPLSVDPLAKIISPAYNTIRFVHAAEENSPTFLNYYKEISGLSESAIVNKLLQLSLAFEKKLSECGKFLVEGTGCFYIDKDHIITFKPEEGLLFLDDSFGLQKIHFAANLNKIKRIIVEKAIITEVFDEDLNQMRESALKELKVLLDQAKIAHHTPDTKSSKIFPIVATVLTLVLLINLALFLFKNPVSPLGEQLSKMDLLGNSADLLNSPSSVKVVTPAEKLTAEKKNAIQIVLPIVSDSVNMHIAAFILKGGYYFDSSNYMKQTSMAEPILASLPIAESEIFVSPVVVNINKVMPAEPFDIAENDAIEAGYYLIAGAFKGAKKAHLLVSELEALGHKNLLIIKPTGYQYNLVAYQKFTSLKEAKAVQQKTQEDENWDVWIFTAH
ncbi:MAG: hypothetical protein H7296_00905 [Bacteroidia bacterium]|nr:hypothetical protein [Bacteroidia bacterium]